MAIFVKGIDFSKYQKAHVYLKNHPVPKIEIDGGIVSVETDNENIKIQTKSRFAVFDTQNVAALNFE